MTTTSQNPEVKKLMAEIDSYLAAKGMSQTAFGMWAIHDPNLMRDLKKGRDLRWQTIKAIREKMAGADAA